MNFFDKINRKLFGFQPTYSQCGEDIILNHIFSSRNLERITYLDIGTNHPITFNNTYFFYRNGSNGVCVEPNPSLNNLIKNKRKRDTCLNVGVAGSSQNEMEFYIINPHTLSTFSKQDAIKLEKEGSYKIEQILKIPVITLNDILEKYFYKSMPDLISIDVEGLNEEIVASIDLAKYRPKVFCVETLTFEMYDQNKKILPILDKFENNGYFAYADTYLNTIFIDKNFWNK